MDILEVLGQVRELLQQKGRVSYRILKRQFALDDEALDDLKGSTALIEGLDPEEAQTVTDPALQLMMDAVHQYDGYVAQALGDGIFAL